MATETSVSPATPPNSAIEVSPDPAAPAITPASPDPATTAVTVEEPNRRPLSGAALAIGWVAAAFANAVTFTPLLAAWFRSTGSKYATELAEGSLLPVGYLDIDSWTLSLMGFEIVLRSINLSVLLSLFAAGAGVLIGLVGIPLAAFFGLVRRWLRYPPFEASDGLKSFAAWGIVAWGGAILLSAASVCYAAVFVTPDRAVCVAEQRFESIRLNVAGSCTICGRFGEKKLVGYPLISGKDRSILIGRDGARFVGNDSLSPAVPLQGTFAKVREEPASIAAAVDMCSNDGKFNTLMTKVVGLLYGG
jgi:hypothetical protein